MLRRLERALWQLEEQVTQEHVPGLTLTAFTHPPHVLQQALLVRLAQCLRQDIATLASEYGVKREEEDMQRAFHAMLTLLWADLEDSRPQKLRHYGPLHPDVAEQLGPRVQMLIDQVLALDGVVCGTPQYEQVQALLEQCDATWSSTAEERERNRHDKTIGEETRRDGR